jgi:predicted glycogen debranching enzyme
MAPHLPLDAEWLETDGLGGFASGTVSGRRSRRYHALLLTATTPPTGRFVLVNGFDAWVETRAGRFALTSQLYAPGVVYPDGEQRIASFTPEPWPCWTYRLQDGSRMEFELFMPHGVSAITLRWRRTVGSGPLSLLLRPFLSGRDYHSLHHENPSFNFVAEHGDGYVIWRPYPGVPGVIAAVNGKYEHQPVWYRGFLYAEERRRGLDDTEDLASPGILRWDLASGEAICIFETDHSSASHEQVAESSVERFQRCRRTELKRRAGFPTRLHRSADAYIVRRGNGKTIIAGYPWFTDWGRDTFISLRGLCLSTGRLDDARDILLSWAGTVSEGMLPNVFPDQGSSPEYNSVDASLWYIIAVHDYLQAAGKKVEPATRTCLREAVEAILTGYAAGTRYGIRREEDSLLMAGVPGVQLTWMDAKVGDWVVTPRIGKPVEVQALWLNALRIGSELSTGPTAARWADWFAQGRESFRSRFWNETAGYLNDVVDPDPDHQPESVDATFRPNQIFAVGGLPYPLLEGDVARRVVDAVEARLLTPLGLRSLAPESANYVPRYEGGVLQRDGAYHQGTVWPWLMGAFVEAWLRVRPNSPEMKREAQERFIAPLIAHLDEAGLGHISEIADGDAPHTPRGCPFQAWSLAELLRMRHTISSQADIGPSMPLGFSLRESVSNHETSELEFR